LINRRNKPLVRDIRLIDGVSLIGRSINTRITIKTTLLIVIIWIIDSWWRRRIIIPHLLIVSQILIIVCSLHSIVIIIDILELSFIASFTIKQFE
jgi:hypothetical protein